MMMTIDADATYTQVQTHFCSLRNYGGVDHQRGFDGSDRIDALQQVDQGIFTAFLSMTWFPTSTVTVFRVTHSDCGMEHTSTASRIGKIGRSRARRPILH